MINRQEFFSCICNSDEHTVRWTLDKEDGIDPEICFSVYLNNDFVQYCPPSWIPYCILVFLRRIWIGLKYACGYKSKYGDWDCFVLKEEDVDRLSSLLKAYRDLANISTTEKYNKTKKRLKNKRHV